MATDKEPSIYASPVIPSLQVETEGVPVSGIITIY